MLLDWRREVDSLFLSAICLCLPSLWGNFRVDTRRLFNSTQPLFSLSSSVQTRPSEEHWFYYEQSKRSKAPNIAAVPLFVCVFFFRFFFHKPSQSWETVPGGSRRLEKVADMFFRGISSTMRDNISQICNICLQTQQRSAYEICLTDSQWLINNVLFNSRLNIK